jgi:hypothetical protein
MDAKRWVLAGAAVTMGLLVAAPAMAAPSGGKEGPVTWATGSFVNAIATTQDEIIWLDSVDSWENTNRVMATPRAGGKSRVLAPKRGRLGWTLAVFDGRVFWREGKAGSADADEYRMWLYEVPLAGGKPRKVGPARGSLGPLVTPDGLVWSHDEVLYRLDAGAKKPVTVELRGKVDPRVGMGSSLASLDGALYYTALGDTTAPSRLMRAEGGSLRVVTGPKESLRAMTVLDGRLYWIQFASTRDGKITHCGLYTLRGGQAVRVAKLSPASTSPLHASAGSLFWRELHYSSGRSTLVQWPVGEGRARVLVAQLPSGRALAVDSGAIWFGRGGELVRLPR